MYWKIKLTAYNTKLGEVEHRSCEETDSLDLAIASARSKVGPAFQQGPGGAAGQAFSEAEYAAPLAAEKVFLDTGNFNAYLNGLPL